MTQLKVKVTEVLKFQKRPISKSISSACNQNNDGELGCYKESTGSPVLGLFIIGSVVREFVAPLELHLTTSELWFGQEQEGILP